MRRTPKLTNKQDSFDFIHFRSVAQGIAKGSRNPHVQSEPLFLNELL
jgi:hypothetical protein